MLPKRIGESAISTGVFLPESPSRTEKLARLRSMIHVYDPQPGDLAAALVRRALGNAGFSSASSS
jgi:hypothetical protein